VTLLSSLRVQSSKLGCISEFAKIQIYNSKLIHKLVESLTRNVNISSLVNLTGIKTYTLLFGCSTQSPLLSYDNTKCSIVVVSIPAARSAINGFQCCSLVNNSVWSNDGAWNIDNDVDVPELHSQWLCQMMKHLAWILENLNNNNNQALSH
jgi:hypothetical protein